MDRWAGSEWPYVALWAFFCFGALCRGSFMHWLGRRVRRLDSGRRGLADRPVVRRAEAAVRRVGAPAVTLAHLTVGVQSAVLVASGLLRMPLPRFVPALVLGAMTWATIYTTIGMSVLWGALGRGDWRGWLGGAVLVGVVLLASRLAERGLRTGQSTKTRSSTSFSATTSPSAMKRP